MPLKSHFKKVEQLWAVIFPERQTMDFECYIERLDSQSEPNSSVGLYHAFPGQEHPHQIIISQVTNAGDKIVLKFTIVRWYDNPRWSFHFCNNIYKSSGKMHPGLTYYAEVIMHRTSADAWFLYQVTFCFLQMQVKVWNIVHLI